jgi:hypothetical protein
MSWLILVLETNMKLITEAIMEGVMGAFMVAIMEVTM